MEKADAKAVNDIMDRLKLFGGIFGPVVPESLATLDGWTWLTNDMQERFTLTRGAGPVPLIPAIEAAGERKKGWLFSWGVLFSDPDTEVIFVHDNLNVRVSPRFANRIGMTVPNNISVWNNIYDPATPLGPLYGLMWTPAKFWPGKTHVPVFQAQHPSTAFTPTSQVILAIMGRIYIRDSKQFYESIFVESQRQALGTVRVPIRRGS